MADDGSGLGHIVELAELRSQRQRRRPRPEGTEDSGKRLIRLEIGQWPRALDEAEAALIAIDKNLFSFGPKLVTIVWDEIRVSGTGDKDGGREKSLRLSPITAPALLERFELAARFEKCDGRSGYYVQCNCPPALAERYLARDGGWNVPSLLGIVTAPTLRTDGTVLARPGYDAASGLMFEPLGVAFPDIPDLPTEAEAQAALGRLNHVIATFPFENDASRAVALSAILTTHCRSAIASAPIHGFGSPVAGSGKSKLADIPAVITTGHRAVAIAIGRESKGELEKGLSAALLAGDPVILLDNMMDPLGGQLLCQIATQHAVKIRTFNTLKSVTVPCGAMVIANGNNLVIDGDATRRTLVGRINPQCERPELREFDFDPVQRAHEQRPALVADVLTILRAWIVNRDAVVKKMPTPLGSFEQWSGLVREALIWLGETDPVETMEEVRVADPRLSALRTVMTAWNRVFGVNRLITVREVIAEALKEETVVKEGAEIKVRPNQDLLEAVRAIADGKDLGKTLGWWLLRHKDRVVTIGVEEQGRDGVIRKEMRCKFCQDASRYSNLSAWVLQDLDTPTLDLDEAPF